MAKRVDPIKQREKRAKIAAAVGAVLFLAVAAFEVPTILKMMHPKPVVPPPTNVAAADGSVPNAAPATPTGVTASGQLADTDVPPADASGQLIAFDVFQTKDPFRPQVTNAPAGSTSTTPDATATPADTTPGATDASSGASPPVSAVPPTPPSAPAGVTTTPTTTTPAAPTQPLVVISVNNVPSRVATGGVFPSGAPVFRLVSWTKGDARIGIVGGSYATGDQTLELRIGVPVTLQNTSDSQQYKLLLVSTP